ncbi:hypothetical protein DL93DRAFT_2163884 [Clavulina sp. PMI_390]|nr:hypothetical protein DL93DRAFT_2163884 [Clavulina sp. PMI_390]
MTVVTENDYLRHLFPIPQAPQLQSLTCVKKANYMELPKFRFSLLNHEVDTPSLRHLDVENISWKALSNIPLCQLTSLRLSLPTAWKIMPAIQWGEVFGILRQCISLVALHVELIDSRRERKPTEMVDLLTLERLTTYHPELPSHLRTPKLELLHVVQGGATCDPQQPLPHLKVYVVEQPYISFQQWHMPESFSAVQHLHFERCARKTLICVFQTLVENNANDGTHLSSFPHLQTLSLSLLMNDKGGDFWLLSAVFDMLDASPNLRLECVWDDLFANGITDKQREKYAHRIFPLKSSYGDTYLYEDQEMF